MLTMEIIETIIVFKYLGKLRRHRGLILIFWSKAFIFLLFRKL